MLRIHKDKRQPATNSLFDIINLDDYKPKLYQQYIRMSALNQTKLNQADQRNLKALSTTVPPLLFRAYSLEGAKRTKGFCSPEFFRPPTDMNTNKYCYDSLFDMPIEEVKVMGGNHLMWKDRNDDQFISWSRSMLFAIEHALGRSRKGQSQCYISAMETSQAQTTCTNTRKDEQKAEFFWATDVMNAYKIRDWQGWQNFDHSGLHPRKLTHEVLSVGVIQVNDHTKYNHVDLQDLINCGLFKVYPEFCIPRSSHPKYTEHKSTGLYERLTYIRNTNFPRRGALSPEYICEKDLPWESRYYQEVPEIPTEDLCFAFQAALLFRNQDREYNCRKVSYRQDVPSIHLFLHFLSLRRRRRCGNAEFARGVKKYWTASDLKEHIYRGMNQVADNLPESMQYLDLVREACAILGVTPIPPSIVKLGCGRKMAELYRAEDEALNAETDENRKPRPYLVHDLSTGEKRLPGGGTPRYGQRKKGKSSEWLVTD